MNKKMTKKERNIRRGIFFTAAAVIVLLICGSRAKPAYSVESYGIDYGDTLWKIAAEYKPNSMSHSDYINTMYKLNKGLTAEIYPGQAIVIPVYDKK